MKSKIADYLSLIKFSHTIFAMPFAITGYFLGVSHTGGIIELRILALIVLCMVFARNAAMAFNRYADRFIDAANPRTISRELPAGKIAHKHALLFVFVNSLLFVATTYFINNLCFYLSLPALLSVLGYSYTKRFTHLSHFVLGLALSLAPTGAYLAVVGAFHVLPVLLSVSVMFWVGGFDIIYALQDMDFDSRNNLKSVPAAAGYNKSRLWALLSHVASVVCLIVWLRLLDTESFFIHAGLIIFIVLVFFQHVVVARYGLKRVNAAFFTLNGLASVLLGLLTSAGLYLGI